MSYAININTCNDFLADAFFNILIKQKQNLIKRKLAFLFVAGEGWDGGGGGGGEANTASL